MNNKKVYDLPTRTFHWLFAIGFLTAFAIGKTVDDDSPVFAYHMLIGITLVALTLMRIVWGVIGTQHARFSGFALHPKDLIGYLKDIIQGSKRKWVGHNPASSWASIAMILLVLGLGTTGYLMTNGVNKHFFEEVHELFANSFMILVILHIAGIILHTLRHKELIAMSMISGEKNDVPNAQAITKTRPVAAITIFTLTLLTGLYLYQSFNQQDQTLSIGGFSWQLGESENENDKAQESQDNNETEEDED